MSLRTCRYLGAVFAAIWLTSSAIAAPVSDDADFPTFSPASNTVIDRIAVPDSPKVGSILIDPPQISQRAFGTDALDVASGPTSAIAVQIGSPTAGTPTIEAPALNAPQASLDFASRSLANPQKAQEVRVPVAAAAQQSANVIAHQQSSPLIIATPEPGSVGLLLIASTMLLGRRRSISRPTR